ncbi:MAG: ABC transporter ATP-binding protein [Armatimonadota bacterium]|nr:ABC transporter ATP-binding protein [Armatimonadota bacterium]MDR7426498.1 ABC transporter ATP-binding protein [Armatimonadota bacterium]MDR7463395.1 ABC transporter ATP-binding protein [Armatimonadota bacterium]MDR7468550.1 ABC transporter ATP-binding protein [Armatimonadota bacterium]MDR7475143.1 ABC transporter ATP-binding protein [Armatimonadota bacterium]
MNALEIRDLAVRFGSRQVLHRVFLEVPAGRFVSLIGPSGCGKTTLLRTVAGLVRPTAGTLRLLGRSVEGCSREVGILFQEDALLPWRTARENVALGLRFRGISPADALREADAWLERVGLGGFGAYFPYALSGGMKKRVALAQVLATHPRLLLMDEPFASLDAIVRSLLQADFLSLVREAGVTVLLVTHDLEEALLLSESVALMSAGPAARITQVYAVPFPYPRDLIGLRVNPTFGQLLQQIWADLQREVARMGWGVTA